MLTDEVHLVARREVDRDPVLGGVADDGDDDDADEERRQADRLRGLADRADEDLRHHADRHAGEGQGDHALAHRPRLADVVLGAVLGVEEVLMRAQREDQPGHVGAAAGRRRRRPRSPRGRAGNRLASAVGLGRLPPMTSSKIGRHDQRDAGQQQHHDCVLAAVRSKYWRSRLRPPMNIAAPITSRMLPRIEPTSEALTTSCSPSLSAKKAMISSGALPKVTFRKPPMPGPGARRQLLGRAAHQRGGRDHARAPRRRRSTEALACTSSSAIAIGMNGTSTYGQPAPLRRNLRRLKPWSACVTAPRLRPSGVS